MESGWETLVGRPTEEHKWLPLTEPALVCLAQYCQLWPAAIDVAGFQAGIFPNQGQLHDSRIL